ncbi:HAMP domain-containing histidine kinase [Paenibacillus sp. J5C_2022]|uniref:sensor histidine kinase n=1 Tax=Paenibacillus sp. J5C2022 TaxID=2977129 RepID=UPI0021CF3F86|nr:HAMP domain-containing sensor histidine kinase [Paenibacillus sp. J5C2022]MCU6708483.1 HAMP domain-containing histidine kinase [Paenibacillus sp. J5C2022]
MIRSLYFRITLTFLVIVLISIALSFLLTNQLFKQHVRGSLQSDIHRAIEQIEQLYQVSRPASLQPFLEEVANMHHFSIVAADGNGTRLAAGPYGNAMLEQVTNRHIRMALRGASVFPYAWSGDEESGERRRPPAIGKTIRLNGQDWALFVQPNQFPKNSNFLLTVLTLIGSLLVIGSTLIAIAAKYLVKPIKQLHEAALGIAAGNFSVHLPAHGKDELGQLAGSMNTMAESLSRIEMMRQEFVANVSHEIQSPLTSINGFAAALSSETLSAEERQRYIGIIRFESSRLSKLSENLLKLSSLDSQHHPFHPKPYRLDRQLRDVILANEPAWLAKRLQVELYAEETFITADEDCLNAVWTNLLVNSIKFTPDGGTIVFRLIRLENTAEVHVTDTGVGIAEEERERIFERFYKTDRSHNRHTGGSGLGLSISSKIVKLHGGTIELASSSADGRGAHFIVTLPNCPLHEPKTREAACHPLGEQGTT